MLSPYSEDQGLIPLDDDVIICCSGKFPHVSVFNRSLSSPRSRIGSIPSPPPTTLLDSAPPSSVSPRSSLFPDESGFSRIVRVPDDADIHAAHPPASSLIAVSSIRGDAQSGFPIYCCAVPGGPILSRCLGHTSPVFGLASIDIGGGAGVDSDSSSSSSSLLISGGLGDQQINVFGAMDGKLRCRLPVIPPTSPSSLGGESTCRIIVDKTATREEQEEEEQSTTTTTTQNTIFVGGRQGSVCQFDVGAQRLVQQFSGHEAEVWGLAASVPSRSPKMLFSASQDRTVRIWSLNENRVEQHDATRRRRSSKREMYLSAMAFSCFYVDSARKLLVGTLNGTVEVWDPRKTKKRVKMLRPAQGWINDIDCLDSHARTFVSASEDKSVSVWNLKNGRVTGFRQLPGTVYGVRVMRVSSSSSRGERRPKTGPDAAGSLSERNGVGRKQVEEAQEEEETGEEKLSTPPPTTTTTKESPAADSELFQALCAFLLEDFYPNFVREQATVDDFPEIANDDELLALLFDNPVPKTIPKMRFVRCVTSPLALSCSKEGMEEFFSENQLLPFLPAFVDAGATFGDLPLISQREELLSGLIPKKIPMRRFVRACFRKFGSSENEPSRSTAVLPFSPSPFMTLPGPDTPTSLGMIQDDEVSWDSVTSVGEPFATGAFAVCRRGVFQCMEVVVKDCLIHSPEHEEMAIEEFMHLRRFQHKKVIRVYGYSRRDEPPTMRLILEAMKTNLHDYVTQIHRRKESPSDHPPTTSSASLLTILQKFEILWQCADVLRYLHGRKALHRDIKGSNFLLSGNLDATSPDFRVKVKVADFGLVRQKHSDAVASVMTSKRGTLFWMSPEAFRGRGQGGSAAQYGYLSDIFSFSMMSWEVLYGCVPFHSSLDQKNITSFNVPQHIRNGGRPSLEKLSQMCEPFAVFISELWARPASPKFRTMTSVVEWFEANHALMREEYSRVVFNDAVDPADGKREVLKVDVDSMML